jgi:hypothetical protein
LGKARADKIKRVADSSAMDERVISGLRMRSRAVRDRWEKLLRADRVTSPVAAGPDALLAMIPTTMEQIFSELGRRADQNSISLAAARAMAWPRFACGYNPYISFLKAGERALLETLVLVQFELNSQDQRDVELANFFSVIRGMAAQESREFCSDCNYRGDAEGCRFAGSAHARVDTP